MFGLISLSNSVLYEPHVEKSFLAWMRQTNNFYTGEEYQMRFGIWATNQRLVREHNRNSTFTVELNKFAHLTPSEYKALLGFKQTARVSSNNAVAESCDDTPLDWRDKKVVNAAKDQGQCGSCWAFSTIQALESRIAIVKGKLYTLSEQNLVDCVTGCYGCNGGLMTIAYDYIISKQSGKVSLDSEYPYKAVEQSCRFNVTSAIGTVKTYVEIKEGSESDLMAKCKTYGPVAIAIDASHWSFQLYHSGIYDEPSCSASNLDHGVGLVGWGSESGKEYYIIRNSWGTSWGEQGYMRMLKNGKNRCGVATMACVPTTVN